MNAATANAQQTSDFKTDYSKEYDYAAQHLVQLAETMPANKYSWSPGQGVRTVSQVYVHIAVGNFVLLSLTGVKLPADYYPNLKLNDKGEPDMKAIFARSRELEKTLTSKDQVQQMLKTSLDDVRDQLNKLSPADLDKPADFFGEKTTVRYIYIHILAHVNEHFGQSIAYARMNGVVPPWSK